VHACDCSTYLMASKVWGVTLHQAADEKVYLFTVPDLTFRRSDCISKAILEFSHTSATACLELGKSAEQRWFATWLQRRAILQNKYFILKPQAAVRCNRLLAAGGKQEFQLQRLCVESSHKFETCMNRSTSGHGRTSGTGRLLSNPLAVYLAALPTLVSATS